MFTKDEVLQAFIELVVVMKDVEAEEVLPTASFAELSLDSLDFVEIQVNSQKDYGVDLPPELFVSHQIVNFEQLAEYIVLKSQK